MAPKSNDGAPSVEFEYQTLDQIPEPVPRLTAAYAAWSAASKVDGIARRQDIEIETIRDAIGHVGIVDVLRDGQFRYRLFGSGLVAALGYDATGRLSSDLTPASYAAVITAQYGEVVARRAPVVHETRNMRSAAVVSRYFRLTIPLTLGSGSIDQLWMTVAMLGSFGAKSFVAPTLPALLSRKD